ncbi:phosphodiester glycosidase family protein [Phaeobacter sp. 22II1-1F12B]|uniref:phosphodiester glycosidase family protein n=1 Tax=Phaeobacter sp. 22II1-1F12B TaxID=1317111 RepID=UPI0018EA0735|nr:phosphodiester glycosidase family protein [Phaeobacter sp. 22II1-1F12B]
MPRALPALFLLLLGLAAAPEAQAVECRDVDQDSNRYTVCEANAESDELRLFLYDEEGQPYGQFGSVAQKLDQQGKTLVFAMNAGMYHSDRAPVGYYAEPDKVVQKLIPNAGPGNFGMLPNGVFCIGQNRADVIETLRFSETQPACDYATQSGPMLVIDGELHPRFLPDSDSRYVRNGVGTSADGKRVVFAISRNRVTFHEFGSLFRDVLDLPNALYFDGNISRLYAPDFGRNDAGFAMGPIVGIATTNGE